MPGIFISYRREDSSGHAGRIGDRLRQRFGDLVFQDVDNIADGEVFETVIDRALGACDVALIVIGRNWLTSTDQAGRRRLDDPGDWVRTEIRMVLSRNIRVIPVLVGGAAMPSSEALPDDVRQLLKRQAREIRDTSWDSDMDSLVKRLEQIVSPARDMKQQSPVRNRPGLSTRLAKVAGVAVAVLVGGMAWWQFRNGPANEPPSDAPTSKPAVSTTAAEQPKPPTKAGSVSPAPGRDTPSQAARPIQPTFLAIPEPGQAPLGAAIYQLMSIRLEPYDAERDSLIFAIRMINQQATQANFWSLSFKLLVDGIPLEPSDLLNVLVDPHAALDRELTFTVTKAGRQVVLQISRAGEKAAVPIDTSARAAPPVKTESAVLPRQTKLPLQLPAGTTVRMGDIQYEVLSAEIDRHNFEMDRVEVRIGLRATNKGRYDTVFSDGALRLLVDGVLRAPTPSISRFHERLQSGAEMHREFTFVEVRPTQSLALGFLDRSAGRYTTTIPLLPKPGA
jgi:TIR domain